MTNCLHFKWPVHSSYTASCCQVTPQIYCKNIDGVQRAPGCFLRSNLMIHALYSASCYFSQFYWKRKEWSIMNTNAHPFPTLYHPSLELSEEINWKGRLFAVELQREDPSQKCLVTVLNTGSSIWLGKEWCFINSDNKIPHCHFPPPSSII